MKKVIEGSKPPITETEAYRMKLDGYNRYSNVAVFKFESMNKDLMTPCAKGVFDIFQLLSEVCESDMELNANGWQATVAVSGSSALALLESHLMTNRSGQLRGRWKAISMRGGFDSVCKKKATALDIARVDLRLGKGDLRSVNDVDIFVSGIRGATHVNFRHTVDNFVNRMRSVCMKKGMNVEGGPYRENAYVEMGSKVLIRDVFVGGMDTKISFIQSRECGTVMEVLKRFDIDVCQVMFNMKRKELYTSLEVLDAIEKGHASICDFFLSSDGPTAYEAIQIKSTIGRMHKYLNRGYVFNRYPKLQRAGYTSRTMPKSTWEE